MRREFYKERKECHLCDNALEILEQLQMGIDLTLKLVDIEENDHLEEKYGLYISCCRN